MKIYFYDPTTGEYKGEREAKKSPLDNEWLIPMYSTTNAPPIVGENEVACFINNEWVEREDHRGSIIYNKKTGISTTILEIGEISTNYTTLVPPEFSVWKTNKWVIDKTKKKENSNIKIKGDLSSIDAKSVRAIREWLVQQEKCPDILKIHEKQAIETRKSLA